MEKSLNLSENIKKTVSTDLDLKITIALKSDRKKIIVLDDDPTGMQTVHGVPVYTSYELKDIKDIFENGSRLSFILTNTRAVNGKNAEKINKTICKRILKISNETGIDFELISRSDSTLRGHYPLETNTLKEILETQAGKKVDGEILIFSFFEAGRYTIGDTHYLKEGSRLIPVAETEFARDSDFGYLCSDLKEYIEEKTGGKYKKEDVESISLKDIREGGPNRIKEKLKSARGYKKIVVNSKNYDDLKTFVLGLLLAEKEGKRFLFRSAASFVKVRAGIEDKDNISKKDIKKIQKGSPGKGLAIVGSYVRKTTSQLERLLTNKNIYPVKFDVLKAADKKSLKVEINRCKSELNKGLDKGFAVLYTSRDILKPQDKDLKISGIISEALVEIVKNIDIDPGFIIAKGGITSFDIAVKALGLRKAIVAGQIISGVPLIILGGETRFPQTPYIIFPGNVGEEDSLKRVVNMFIE